MRYVGSKKWLAKYILPFIYKALEVHPNGRYIEPFAGGCNMIAKVRHHTRIGYDVNPYLIALIHEVRNNPAKIRDLKWIPRKVYKYVKANKEQFQEWFVGAIGLLTTYCSQWMGSYIGDLYPGRFTENANCLLSHNFSDISLYHADYKNIPIGKGDTIYCDPPYKAHDFYGMPFNHEEFYEWVRKASKDNIVLVSEYEMPDDFTCIWQKKVTPRNRPKAKKRYEKLFIYTG